MVALKPTRNKLLYRQANQFIELCKIRAANKLQNVYSVGCTMPKLPSDACLTYLREKRSVTRARRLRKIHEHSIQFEHSLTYETRHFRQLDSRMLLDTLSVLVDEFDAEFKTSLALGSYVEIPIRDVELSDEETSFFFGDYSLCIYPYSPSFVVPRPFSIKYLGSPDNERDNHSHPHVLGGRLCEGGGGSAIGVALKQCDLVSLYLLIESIMRTYYADGAYILLQHWTAPSCDCCGAFDTIGFTCDICGEYCCEECAGTCECGALFCTDCASCCHGCGFITCSACFSEEFNLCGVCTGYFCDNCYRRCTTCSTASCKYCGNFYYCRNCGTTICADHFNSCEKCGQRYCDGCMSGSCCVRCAKPREQANT